MLHESDIKRIADEVVARLSAVTLPLERKPTISIQEATLLSPLGIKAVRALVDGWSLKDYPEVTVKKVGGKWLINRLEFLKFTGGK